MTVMWLWFCTRFNRVNVACLDLENISLYCTLNKKISLQIFTCAGMSLFGNVINHFAQNVLYSHIKYWAPACHVQTHPLYKANYFHASKLHFFWTITIKCDPVFVYKKIYIYNSKNCKRKILLYHTVIFKFSFHCSKIVL
jgi:hypothetical protein